MADTPATYDANVTLRTNAFTKTGYTFAGWNTSPSGTGTSYTDGQVFKYQIAGNLTLYAQWTPITYTINYVMNGGTNDPSNPASYTIENTPRQIRNATWASPYSFRGWTVVFSDGKAPVTTPTLNYVIPTGTIGTVTLTAHWERAFDLSELQVGNSSKVYGDTDPALPASLVTGWPTDAPSNLFDITVSRASGESVGNYAINATVTVKPDYAPDTNAAIVYRVSSTPKSGNFAITQAPLVISSPSASQNYNGSALTRPTVTVTGLKNSDTYTGLLATGTITDPGNVTNTIDESSAVFTSAYGAMDHNYQITRAPGTLTVNVNPTVITITGASQSKVYDGDPLTNDGYTTSTLPTGVTRVEASVSGSQTNAGSSNNVVGSNYTLWNGDEDVTNYFARANLVPGTLQVTARPITISPTNASKNYDGTPLVATDLTISGMGLLEGDTLQGASVSGSQTTVGNATTYASNAVIYDEDGVNVSRNYAISYQPGYLSVYPAYLYIYAPSITLTAGSPRPITFSNLMEDANYVGFVNGDGPWVLDGRLIWYISYYTPASPVGSSYPITMDGVSAANYVIFYMAGAIDVVGYGGGTTTVNYTTATVTGVVPATGAPELVVPLQEPPTPLASTPTTTSIPDDTTPTTAAPLGHWALLNLILALIGIISAILLLVTFLTRRSKKEEDNDGKITRKNKRFLWRLINIIAGILAVILFLLTENMTLPMAIVDSWTIYHVIIIVVQVALVLLATQRKTKDDGDMNNKGYVTAN